MIPVENSDYTRKAPDAGHRGKGRKPFLAAKT